MLEVVNLISGCVTSLLIDKSIECAKEKAYDNQLALEIQAYLDNDKRQRLNEVSALPYDFQVITDLFWNDIKTVKTAIIGTYAEREQAKGELVKAAIEASNDTPNAANITREIILDVLNISRHFYREKLDTKEKYAISEIVDELKSGSDRLINLNALPDIANAEELENEIEKLKREISPRHILYPYYATVFGENGSLISKPTSQDALSKYPPQFTITGIPYIDEKPVNNFDYHTIEYANNHQKEISLKITNAVKMLGDVLDPYQKEAKSMIGGTLIKKPTPFPPAQPCSIKVGEQTYFDYVELRLEKIIDDNTFVISNKEQQDTNLLFTIKLDYIKNSATFKVKIVHKDNKSHLQYLKFVKAISSQEVLTVYALKSSQNMFKSICDPINYETAFDTIDNEIELYQMLCDIENFFKKRIELPDEINYGEYRIIENLSNLINNEQVEVNSHDYCINMIVSEETEQRISELGDEELMLAIVTTLSFSLFEHTFELPIRRHFNFAQINELDKLKRKVALADVGDTMNLYLTCKECFDYLITEEDGELFHKIHSDEQQQ